MAKVRPNSMSHAQFFELCKWLEKQPSPMVMTLLDAVSAYHADTGKHVSRSGMDRASEVTGVKIGRNPAPERINFAKNRTRTLAKLVESVVRSLDTALDMKCLSEKEAVLLQRLICNQPIEEKPE